MIKVVSLFIVNIILISCHQASIRTRNIFSCVNIQERIMSRDTGVSVFHKGLQEQGYAKSIKINQPWEASVSATLIQR